MLTEQDFYGSFAEWLVENDEVTVASALGGSSLGGKWGTPDVIGVLKPRAQDIFKFEPQIVTAEIKAVPTQPVVAFGQAVAYRLFSHKSYVVVPKPTTSDDMSRLTSLCSLHGVGLVTFTLNKDQPDYAVVVLPAVAAPDMFYVNSMLERLKASEPSLLNELFSDDGSASIYGVQRDGSNDEKAIPAKAQLSIALSFYDCRLDNHSGRVSSRWAFRVRPE